MSDKCSKLTIKTLTSMTLFLCLCCQLLNLSNINDADYFAKIVNGQTLSMVFTKSLHYRCLTGSYIYL